MIEQESLFERGWYGYHTCRIPALLRAANGDLLAFCEGRRDGHGDAGKIDILLRRSTDNGSSWSEPQIVREHDENTCGNPSPVLDPASGDVILLSTWNLGADRESAIVAQESRDTRRVFLQRSGNHGKTWSEPEEVTSAVKQRDWTWYATGPGAGIAIERGRYQGRLVIPCDHIEAETEKRFSHAIYSDDRGYTWQIGGASEPGCNECGVVELSDGRLMLNMRNHLRTETHRKIAYSDDGGETWYGQHSDPVLIEPVCQASVRRYRRSDEDRPGVILFSNPACTFAETIADGGRRNMMLRASFDDARTWPKALVLFTGRAGYSDISMAADGTVCCLYEAGEERYSDRIVLARVGEEWLER